MGVLWEWPAFSGCPCGNGQSSVGVRGEEKGREGVGRRERDRRFQKDSSGFSRLSVESPPEGPGEGTGGARKGGEGATWTGLFDADTPGARPAEQCSATCKIQ